MTNLNIESYFDVIDDIASFSSAEKSLITIDMQRVWQDRDKGSLNDFETTQIRIREAFIQEGFKVNELKHIDKSRCYADQENHISLNYDGRLLNVRRVILLLITAKVNYCRTERLNGTKNSPNACNTAMAMISAKNVGYFHYVMVDAANIS